MICSFGIAEYHSRGKNLDAGDNVRDARGNPILLKVKVIPTSLHHLDVA